MSQIVTPEFAAWLSVPETDYQGAISADEIWDAEEAWPDPEAMRSARQCYAVFAAGDLAAAKEHLDLAQRVAAASLAAAQDKARFAHTRPAYANASAVDPQYVQMRYGDAFVMGIFFAMGFSVVSLVIWLLVALLR